jgi:hypothetical protein
MRGGDEDSGSYSESDSEGSDRRSSEESSSSSGSDDYSGSESGSASDADEDEVPKMGVVAKTEEDDPDRRYNAMVRERAEQRERHMRGESSSPQLRAPPPGIRAAELSPPARSNVSMTSVPEADARMATAQARAGGKEQYRERSPVAVATRTIASPEQKARPKAKKEKKRKEEYRFHFMPSEAAPGEGFDDWREKEAALYQQMEREHQLFMQKHKEEAKERQPVARAAGGHVSPGAPKAKTADHLPEKLRKPVQTFEEMIRRKAEEAEDSPQ